MSILANATDADLRAELERRERERKRGAIPQPMDTIDWSPVLSVCEQYRDFVASDEYHEDNDFANYIYEAAIAAVFGDGFWNWKRDQ